MVEATLYCSLVRLRRKSAGTRIKNQAEKLHHELAFGEDEFGLNIRRSTNSSEANSANWSFGANMKLKTDPDGQLRYLQSSR